MVVNLEKAINKAKTFLAEMKGMDVKLSNRPLIDWLNFEAIGKDNDEPNYDLICTFQENIFSEKKAKFIVSVNKDSGDIVNVKRIEEEQ